MARAKKKTKSSIDFREAYNLLRSDPGLYERALLNPSELEPEAQRALRAVKRLHRKLGPPSSTSESPLLAKIGCMQQ